MNLNESDFTSIQERIRTWQNEMMATSTQAPGQTDQNTQPASSPGYMPVAETATEMLHPVAESSSAIKNSLNSATLTESGGRFLADFFVQAAEPPESVERV